MKGKIEKVFYNKDNWASVLVTGFPEEEIVKAGFPKSKTAISTTGMISSPVEGTVMIFTGCWYNDKKYGLQFKVSKSELDGDDYSNIISYLSSDFVKGCGSILAKSIVEEFGKDTFDIILNYPERLIEADGIGKIKAKTIHESFVESQAFLKIFQAFNGNISTGKCQKILKRYGTMAKVDEVIKKNPYQLIYDIRGFGFATVDKLALATGIAANDPRRVKAAIVFSLEEVTNIGHCFLDSDELGTYVRDVISKNKSVSFEVEDSVIAEQIVDLQKEGYLVCEKHGLSIRVYHKDLYNSEVDLAKKICALKSSRTAAFRFNEAIVDDTIYSVELDEGIEFESLQREAVKRSLRNNISIITGGPGTGKSTIVKAISLTANKLGLDLIQVAPTGRASRRLAAATGYEASTIAKFNASHSLSKLPEYNNTVFVVDEASMIDIETASELFSHIDESCIVVLVGDIDQLPPIGPGNFFRELVSSRIVPCTRLQTTHRFSGGIALNANKINRGDGGLVETEDFVLFKSKDKDERQKLILNEYYKALREAKGDYRKVQIIVPKRVNSETGATKLNEIIREKLNPIKRGDKTFGNNKFRLNDRVMQTKNNEHLGVANGDCGVVVKIGEDKMEVLMDVGGRIEYSKEESERLVIAYAITVHKSQGSEYMTVISSYGTGDYILLQRNLLYTAVTRAKKKMIMIYDPQAVYMAVNNIKPIIRNTSLIEKINKFSA